MSSSESLFRNVDVKVPKRSGFDKSHMNLLTTKCGTLTPLLCDEVIPNTSVSLKINLSATLPPLASDTFMRCELKAEAFFVPYRICYGGFQDWIQGNLVWSTTNSGKANPTFPVLEISNASEVAPGTLSDYLGYKVNSTITPSSLTRVNILPYIAYHKIYDEWYRNSLVQAPVFRTIRPSGASTAANSNFYTNVGTLPSITFNDVSDNTYNVIPTSDTTRAQFADGVMITALRQRNFGLDYFTTAQPQAQNGDAQKVSFTVPTSGSDAGNGSFTISALRAANSMQQFLERNGLAGDRFVDYVKAHWGANLNDAIAQRPLLLGSASFDVYSKGIYQTANGTGTTNNPFDGSVGAQFGSAYASGSDFIIKNFTANEPGVIMVLVSLVPKVTYSTGVRRMLTHYIGTDPSSLFTGKVGGQTDMATPLLQNVGNQPIYSYELDGNLNSANVFGYTDRYAEWKTMEDELHGLLRDGQSLESFALQRTFANNSSPTIATAFLAIPTDYMDQVTAANDSISNYGVWIDSYLDYKVSMPLSRYAVPSLQDPAYEHGEDVSIQRAGTHL